MLLEIGCQAQMPYCRGQLTVKIPVLVIFSAMKIQKVLQQHGWWYQFRIQFFGEILMGIIHAGYIQPALQVVMGKNADFFVKFVYGVRWRFFHGSYVSLVVKYWPQIASMRNLVACEWWYSILDARYSMTNRLVWISDYRASRIQLPVSFRSGYRTNEDRRLVTWNIDHANS